nr:uncharacterized protein LOC122271868 [Parasteatoda tepidariorum]
MSTTIETDVNESSDSEDGYDPANDLTAINPDTINPKRDFIVEAMTAQTQMSSVGASKKSKLSVNDRERILSIAANFISIINTQNAILNQLRGRLYEKTEQVKMTKPSYASILMKDREVQRERGDGPRERDTETKEHELLMYPKDENGASDDTRSQVTNSIDPIKLKLGVRGINRIRKGGIVVQLTNEEEIQKLKLEIEKSNIGDKFACARPRTLNPKIWLYDVPEDVNKENLIDKIRDQNPPLKNSVMKMCFPLRAKEGSHWVIEVDPDTFHKIIYLEKINIGWNRIRTKEFLRVTQCFKCYRFGHVARYCKDKSVCANCTEHDHTMENCKNKSICINCKTTREDHNLKLNINHDATNRNCETYKWEMERLVKKIYYG